MRLRPLDAVPSLIGSEFGEPDVPAEPETRALLAFLAQLGYHAVGGERRVVVGVAVGDRNGVLHHGFR